MVSPGFLENPEVREWLNGVEPAWTMLDFDSFNALHDEPSVGNQAIRLEPISLTQKSRDLRSRPIRYSCYEEQPKPVD